MCKRNAPLFYVLVASMLVATTMLSGTAWAEKPTLMAQWKLDDGSGKTAADSSGNEYDGTFASTSGGLGTNGSVWVEDADHGMVASFDATNYIDTELTLPEMTLDKDFTWAFWGKVDASQVGTSNVILGNRNNGTQDPLQFIKFTPSAFEFYNAANYGFDYADIEGDVWMHHVVVKDGDTLSYYRDGAQSMTTTLTVTIDENPFYIGGDAQGEYFMGYLSDVRLYEGALSADEIALVMNGDDLNIAAVPAPADDAADVLRDVTLSWTASDDAVAHDVYFGTSADDVAAASRTNPLDVLVAEGQTETSYDLGLLEYGQTYYWRIDEVAANDTIHTGSVWTFTVEPFTYAITDITATATGTWEEGKGPENTVNGSGLDNDLHSVESSDMCLITVEGDEVAQILYTFDRAYCLNQMIVWNFNILAESMVGFGAKDVTVEYSTDGAEWTALADVEIPQAAGEREHAADAIVELNNVKAQYVRLTISSNWGTFNSYGLSEVRFLSIPMWARLPQPEMGTTDLDPEVTLSWRAGRQADSHNVYIDTDEQAVIDGTAPMATADENSYDVAIDLGQTYYWRVDEVNEAEDPAVWEGDVWTLSTTTYMVVDDFEGYTDDAGNEVFSAWVDGVTTEDSGSTVGHMTSPFAETTLVYAGKQSMPLTYDNTGDFTISTAVRTFDETQDWSAHGIKSLSLMFMGDSANTGGELYVEIAGTKIPYDGNTSNLQSAIWTTWIVDLTSVDVQSVDSLAIGIDGDGAAGTLYIDEIRLYPYAAEVVTPVDPGTEGLVAYYPLDSDASDAAGDHDGTFLEESTFVTGVVGQALQVSGTAGEISVAYADDLALNSFTVAAWINIDSLASARGILGTRFNGDNTFDLKVESTRIHADVGSGSAWLNTNVDIDTPHGGAIDTNTWYHVVYAVDASGAVNMYLNGVLATSLDLGGTPLLMKSGQEFHIGNASGTEYMYGLIDEVRVYNRALTEAEVAGLAGLTEAFYSAF